MLARSQFVSIYGASHHGSATEGSVPTIDPERSYRNFDIENTKLAPVLCNFDLRNFSTDLTKIRCKGPNYWDYQRCLRSSAAEASVVRFRLKGATNRPCLSIK